MIRTVITPDKKNISIDVPERYIGRQIEILLYATDELKEGTVAPKPKMSRFRGALRLTEKQRRDLRKHLKDVRDEWERDI